MNKKISLGAALAYMAIIAAVVFSLTMLYSMQLFNARVTDLTEKERLYSKLAEIDRFVRENNYGEINENELIEGLANGYIASLGDVQAQYLSNEQYDAYKDAEDTRYVGIGVVTSPDESGYILVKEVYPDSPADVAGIEPGNLIINVDGVTAVASNYEELTAKFKGHSGEKVTITVRVNNEDREFRLTRRIIDVPTVKTAVTDGIGYITFTEINSSTAIQLSKALDNPSNLIKAAIIDMRGQTSESLKHISDMLDILLPKGIVAYSEDRDGNLTSIASSDENYIKIPLVVIADHTTKGTTELFVMALRDYDIAKIVGQTTFGSGKIQELHKLSDGSALLLTTARYVGPAGETYDLSGAEVDYDVVLTNDSSADRSLLIGNYELDAPYRKAVDLANAAISSADADSSASSGN